MFGPPRHRPGDGEENPKHCYGKYAQPLLPDQAEGADCPLCLSLFREGAIDQRQVCWLHPDPVRNPLAVSFSVGGETTKICRVCAYVERGRLTGDLPPDVPFEQHRRNVFLMLIAVSSDRMIAYMNLRDERLKTRARASAAYATILSIPSDL